MDEDEDVEDVEEEEDEEELLLLLPSEKTLPVGLLLTLSPNMRCCCKYCCCLGGIRGGGGDTIITLSCTTLYVLSLSLGLCGGDGARGRAPYRPTLPVRVMSLSRASHTVACIAAAA
jgi:hypothetical protein